MRNMFSDILLVPSEYVKYSENDNLLRLNKKQNYNPAVQKKIGQNTAIVRSKKKLKQ